MLLAAALYNDRIYIYLEQRMTEANLTKDPEIMEEVVKHLRSMRDTWKEVMRLNTPAGKTQVS